jgi:hypothetical protein
MNQKDKPVKKANSDSVKEVVGHPDGPSLEEMINGEEEKVLKKNKAKKPGNGEPDGGPIPVI